MTGGERRGGARGRALGLGLALALAAASAATAGGDAGFGGTVNINTATVEQLQLLPGIGEARARALLELRTQRGRFENVEELLDVRGIGESGLEKLRPHVTLKGKTTASHP